MLKIDRIDTYYGRVQALKQCSLDVAAGEFVTLLAPTARARAPCSSPSSACSRYAAAPSNSWASASTARRPDAIIRKGHQHRPGGTARIPEFTVAENLVIEARARRSTHHEIQRDIERILAQFPA